MSRYEEDAPRDCPNELDGPGRCGCWIHRRRRLAVYGAPYDEYQGTDAEMEATKRRDGRTRQSPCW